MELEFEIPFRELGFSGVPHRTASNVMPTVNCLVRAHALGPPALHTAAHPLATRPGSSKIGSVMSTGVRESCWECPCIGLLVENLQSRVSR